MNDFPKHPVRADDDRLLGHIARDDVNPKFFVAFDLNGDRVPMVDAPTMKDARDDFKALARAGVL